MTAPKIIGFALASFKDKDPNTGQLVDNYVLNPGDTINILTIGAGKRDIEPVYSPFVIAGYIKTHPEWQDLVDLSTFFLTSTGLLMEARGASPEL